MLNEILNIKKNIRKKFKQKVGINKILCNPHPILAQKKKIFFRLIKEYFILASLQTHLEDNVKRKKYKLKFAIKKYKKNNSFDFFKLQEAIEDYKALEPLYNRNFWQKNQLYGVIEEFTIRDNSGFRLIDFMNTQRIGTRFHIRRFLKTYFMRKGDLAGLKNNYFKGYGKNYLRVLSKRRKKIKKKNHFGELRAKSKIVHIKTYLSRFSAFWGNLTSAAALAKNNKLIFEKFLYPKRSIKKRIHRKKNLSKFTLRLAKTNHMRFTKLAIPEFSDWSTRILKQINGEY